MIPHPSYKIKHFNYNQEGTVNCPEPLIQLSGWRCERVSQTIALSYHQLFYWASGDNWWVCRERAFSLNDPGPVDRTLIHSLCVCGCPRTRLHTDTATLKYRIVFARWLKLRVMQRLCYTTWLTLYDEVGSGLGKWNTTQPFSLIMPLTLESIQSIGG